MIEKPEFMKCIIMTGRIGVIYVAVLFTSASMAGDLSRTLPDSSLSPLDVTMIVMNALQRNDEPNKNRGIAVTFNFASPANKTVTGPLARFVNMVNGPVYADRIGQRGANYENIEICGDHAGIDVVLKTASGRFIGFRFILRRQRDNQYDGAWMTDSVIPIEVVSS